MQLSTSILALLAAAHGALATIGYGTAAGNDVAWIDGDPCHWTYISSANDIP